MKRNVIYIKFSGTNFSVLANQFSSELQNSYCSAILRTFFKSKNIIFVYSTVFVSCTVQYLFYVYSTVFVLWVEYIIYFMCTV